MDERCPTCGFAEEDYRGRFDAPFLAGAVGTRAALIFDGLAAGVRPAGFATPVDLEETLSLAVGAGRLHEAVHTCHEVAAGAARLALGEGYGARGRIAALHSSRGGVPKLPVEEAEISWRGIVGDRQREYKHHGHAWQALCLWSSEVIATLRAEGHPAGPGLAGENLLCSGLDWARLRSGLRLSLGPEVVAELTAPAAPCKKIKGSFADGNFRRLSHSSHPGSSRWYAAVLRPGRLRVGDAVGVGLFG